MAIQAMMSTWTEERLRARLDLALAPISACCLDDEEDRARVLAVLGVEVKAIVDQAIADQTRSCQYPGCDKPITGVYWQVAVLGDICHTCHKLHY